MIKKSLILTLLVLLPLGMAAQKDVSENKKEKSDAHKYIPITKKQAEELIVRLFTADGAGNVKTKHHVRKRHAGMDLSERLDGMERAYGQQPIGNYDQLTPFAYQNLNQRLDRLEQLMLITLAKSGKTDENIIKMLVDGYNRRMGTNGYTNSYLTPDGAVDADFMRYYGDRIPRKNQSKKGKVRRQNLTNDKVVKDTVVINNAQKTDTIKTVETKTDTVYVHDKVNNEAHPIKKHNCDEANKDKNHTCPFSKMNTGNASHQFTVYFANNSSKLSLNAKKTLDKVVNVLEKKQPLKVVLCGFASADGNYNANKKLSAARIKSCMDYISSKGIDAERLKKASATVDQNRKNPAKSRRVDLYFAL